MGDDLYAVGETVFTGLGAGIVLGYADGEDDAGEPVREAIVGRFASSEKVPVGDLSSAPQAFGDDAAAGATIGEPTHEGDVASAPDGAAGTATIPTSSTGLDYAGEPDAAHETAQDTELAEFRAWKASQVGGAPRDPSTPATGEPAQPDGGTA